MAVIGFSFNKFDCERKNVTPSGGIEINHSLHILGVKKTSLKVGGNENDVLRVDFSFDVIYGMGLGKVSISGDVIYTDTKEIVDETAKGWDSEKKLNSMVSEHVHKFVYSKAIVKALDLSDSLNLPSPIPMPKVNISKK